MLLQRQFFFLFLFFSFFSFANLDINLRGKYSSFIRMKGKNARDGTILFIYSLWRCCQVLCNNIISSDWIHLNLLLLIIILGGPKSNYLRICLILLNWLRASKLHKLFLQVSVTYVSFFISVLAKQVSLKSEDVHIRRCMLLEFRKGPDALNVRKSQIWFVKLISGNFEISESSRSGRLKSLDNKCFTSKSLWNKL